MDEWPGGNKAIMMCGSSAAGQSAAAIVDVGARTAQIVDTFAGSCSGVAWAIANERDQTLFYSLMGTDVVRRCGLTSGICDAVTVPGIATHVFFPPTVIAKAAISGGGLAVLTQQLPGGVFEKTELWTIEQ